MIFVCLLCQEVHYHFSSILYVSLNDEDLSKMSLQIEEILFLSMLTMILNI